MALGRFDLGFPDQAFGFNMLSGTEAGMGTNRYSTDIHERVVAAAETGALSCHQAAAL
jgi:hypothetical protein